MAGMMLAVSAVPATAQTTSSSIEAPIQTTEQSTSIHGIVVNANTNQPIGRVLVQAEGKSILTEHDGKFEFSGLTGTTTGVRLTKPGFYAGFSVFDATVEVTVGSPDEIQLKLYPETLFTGTLSETNGDPLAQVQIQAFRRTVDEAGVRWMPSGQTGTNADGQFRLPLQAGEYVFETQYAAERPGLRGAILPVRIPSGGSSGGSGATSSGASTMRLASGSEQHIDLHLAVRPSHTVNVQVDGQASSGPGQFGTQIRVRLANGLTFAAPSRRADTPGEVQVSLPNGSYVLSASIGQRDDAASYGETRVTVADEDVSGVSIHLQKALEMSVEASVDPASTLISTSANSTAVDPSSPSFVQQLGITFRRTDGEASARAENISLMPRKGAAPSFTLLPGTYRLRTAGYSQWFIESATAGGTDLLTEDLVVDAGSSSLPLRLVVSNQTAAVKGTTKLHGQLPGCAVYLIATSPSAAPVINARSGSDGSFSHNSLPPGSYRVLAAETRLSLDLTDAAMQKRFAPYMKTLTVGAGETGSIDLDAVPASELTP